MDSEELRTRAADVGIEIDSAQSEKCAEYVRLLWHANQQINLTRHTTSHLFIVRDLMDSWQLARLIPTGADVLDIGAGGGVPGIVIAILRPDLQVNLCESVAKKANFLKTAVEHLDLSIPVFHDRAEKVLEDLSFDCCTARAVGPIWKLCNWLTGHWLNARRLLAVKGPNWKTELQEAQSKQIGKAINCKVVSEYQVCLVEADAEMGIEENDDTIAKSFVLELSAKNAP